MKAYVIDASVGAKRFFIEEMSDKAKRIFSQVRDGQMEVITPEFFYVEMANIFWKEQIRKRIAVSEACGLFDDLSKLPVKVYQEPLSIHSALLNALQLGITVYDSLYLTLAENLEIPLITADEGIIRAAKKGGLKFVHSLQEFDF